MANTINTYTAQGSLTIRRLRNGITIFIALTPDKPLWQGVDEKTDAVGPDWSITTNQPTITPKVSTTTNPNIVIQDGNWFYNGSTTAIVFGEDGYEFDSRKRFRLNRENFALTITNNLATKDNYGDDVLTFKGTALIEGAEYQVEKDIIIDITKVGSSSYTGHITAERNILSNTSNTSKLTASLTVGLTNVNVADYYVKWFKGVRREEIIEPDDTDTDKITTIGLGDVHGSTLIIADYYLKDGDKLVDSASVSITDSTDEYKILYTSSNNSVGDQNTEGKGVQVIGNIFNQTNNQIVSEGILEQSWITQVLDYDDLSVKKSVESNTIDITTSDTDKEDGTYHDVIVVGEVEFTLTV